MYLVQINSASLKQTARQFNHCFSSLIPCYLMLSGYTSDTFLRDSYEPGTRIIRALGLQLLLFQQFIVSYYCFTTPDPCGQLICTIRHNGCLRRQEEGCGPYKPRKLPHSQNRCVLNLLVVYQPIVYFAAFPNV